MRILVTDSDTRSALAAVRSLGRRGYEVFTSGHRYPSLAAVSRFSAEFEKYPDPAMDPIGFIAQLTDITRRRQIDIVLPMTEITTLLLAQNAALLPPDCTLPFSDSQTLSDASDKAYVIELANKLAVPTPRTFIVRSASEGIRRSDDLPYPVVVKPARSRVQVGMRWVSTGVAYASDPATLSRHLRRMGVETYPVLLQERIEGPGRGVFACFDQGRPVAWFAHRRLREKPPSGGVSVLCESMPLDATAVDYAARLLSHLRWHGVAMVEFKQDKRDGSLRLMEINARFWGSLQLAIDAGIDFPSILAGIAAGDRPPPSPNYRIGMQSRWLAGDLDALLMTLSRTGRRLNLPASHPGRLRALWDFMHLWRRDLKYEIERLDDFGPMRLEWRRWLLRR